MDVRSVVPRHRERIFLVGFKERRGFEFPAAGPKLETILEDNVPEKYTLTDHLWNQLLAAGSTAGAISLSNPDKKDFQAPSGAASSAQGQSRGKETGAGGWEQVTNVTS